MTILDFCALAITLMFMAGFTVGVIAMYRRLPVPPPPSFDPKAFADTMAAIDELKDRMGKAELGLQRYRTTPR